MHTERRLPAEWEEQDGVLLAWPHAETDWCSQLEETCAVYIEIVRAICRFENVLIVTPEPEKVRSELINSGLDLPSVQIYAIPTNDTWVRDYGPITIYDEGRPLLLDFGFNGWGLKFAADLDNRVTPRLISSGVLQGGCDIPGMILEGGSIESDGAGIMLTTSECLLEANRNPHLCRTELEAHMSSLFGCQRLLWLDHGYLAGDDTDCHIDTLARLAPDHTILYVSCNDPEDEHYEALRAMEKQLTSFRTLAGDPFRLLPLPWPKAVFAASGERLPATYANFLIINGAVLVPTYNDPADSDALTTIAQAFPERETIGIDCRPLIEQHGSLHCVTMQLPKGVLP